jgi:hypothetical protein
MSDRDDLLGGEFEWMDDPAAGTGDASAEPPPSRGPRSLKSDLDRLRKGATASPGRLALLVLAAVVAAAIVAAIIAAVVAGGGDKEQASTTVETRPPATTPAETQPQPAPAPAPPAITVSPTTTLRAGDEGAAVRTLQRALRRLGYSAVTVDGDYGAKTEGAVIAFQRAHDLTADGVVGPVTARAMNRALAQAA